MHRIDTPTAVSGMFGTGKNGYTNGDSATGQSATQLDADVFNAYQEEICSVIEAAGIKLDKASHAQLLAALKALFLLTDDARVSGALQKSNNLSDLESATQAKKNLELDQVGNWSAVQANGGLHSDGNHRIYIDWGTDGKLHLTVDATDVGEMFTTANPPTAAQTGAYPKSGGFLNEGAEIYVINGNTAPNAGDYVSSPAIRATIKGRGAYGVPEGASAWFQIVENVGTLAYAQISWNGFGSAHNFLFEQGGDFRVDGTLKFAGGNGWIATDGNVYGAIWGGYLSNWISGQLGAVNNNISNNIGNVQHWANGTFVTAVRLGGARLQASQKDSGGPFAMGNGEMFVGINNMGTSDAAKVYWYARQLQYLINGNWVAAASA